MKFEWTDEQYALFETVQSFSDKELSPHALDWDNNSFFPVEILKKSADLGLSCINLPVNEGGIGLSRLESTKIFEILAEGCISSAAYLSIHNMVINIIAKYSQESVKKNWLSKLINMESFVSYCLTEPNSGSDSGALATTALKKGSYYIINGVKSFISAGSVSDVYLTMVRTGNDKHKGISAILIPKNIDGVSFGKLEKKMGWRSQPTCMVYFSDVKVPVENLLALEGDGFKIAMEALNGGRLNIAACSIGGAKKALEITKKYMQQRVQFGKKLSDIQVLRFKYAEMFTKFEAARTILWRAANMLDNNNSESQLYCAMAKYYVTESAFQIADECLQLHGGYGYLNDYNIERIFRDLRVHRILEGTNEIMHEIIAKQVFGGEKHGENNAHIRN